MNPSRPVIFSGLATQPNFLPPTANCQSLTLPPSWAILRETCLDGDVAHSWSGNITNRFSEIAVQRAPAEPENRCRPHEIPNRYFNAFPYRGSR